MRKDILAVCILQYTDVTSLAVLCVTAATVFAHSSPTATTSMDLLANTFSYLKVSPIILVQLPLTYSKLHSAAIYCYATFDV